MKQAAAQRRFLRCSIRAALQLVTGEGRPLAVSEIEPLAHKQRFARCSIPACADAAPNPLPLKQGERESALCLISPLGPVPFCTHRSVKEGQRTRSQHGRRVRSSGRRMSASSASRRKPRLLPLCCNSAISVIGRQTLCRRRHSVFDPLRQGAFVDPGNLAVT